VARDAEFLAEAIEQRKAGWRGSGAGGGEAPVQALRAA